ncbi:serine/threonine-protein kinase [Streptomyces sp. NPDC050264]|uniref:serine/threonine-protein kinase n=1 Tax=Streptomyces sp. NPDC050264 TaxID=3155038 RepID=UPI003446A99F
MNEATEVFEPLAADDPRTVAGYRLAARLGAGGMGRVYLSHTQGGRPVAIKVVRPELADDPDFRRRFRREMEAARSVRGAYTAELIDGDADGAPPWLATLYVPGPSLAEAVARRGPLPLPALLWLTAGVAEALQAIHAAGIVHRDLKPSNVLLAADGPRVIDFGISTAFDGTSYTATGATIGTPQFMAPEQASAAPVTAATDVFSLAQTVAFAALGEPLYGNGPAVSVLYRIVHSAPDLSPLPAELRPLLERCLAADAAERATLTEVVEWCRERLGQDADAGAVWREVTGPEITVPSPIPAVPAQTPANPTLVHARPEAVGPNSPWRAPTWSAPRPPRSRRARRLTAAAVTAGVLVLSVLAWTVMDATGTFDSGRDGGASAKGAGTDSSAGASASPSARASQFDAGPRSDGDGKDSGAAADSATSASSTPTADPHAGMWVDAKRSLSFAAPFQREDPEGDIRFSCKQAGCALTSKTSVFTQIFGKPDADRKMCDLMTRTQKAHSLPLAAAAAGTQICVRNRDGDIASLVLQVKSTAMPEIAFVTADMTVWRGRG